MGGKPEIKEQKIASLSSCFWWKMFDTFLCYKFSPNSYFCVFIFCFFALLFIFISQLSLYCNNKYKENHQGVLTHRQKLKGKVTPEGVNLFT